MIPWPILEMQFEDSYKLTRQFKAAFIEHLASVMAVYPTARVEATLEGFGRVRNEPYFPIQKFAKMRPKRSSLLKSPVISDSAR